MRSAACNSTVREWCPFVFTIGRDILHALRTGNGYRSVRMQHTCPGVFLFALAVPVLAASAPTVKSVEHISTSVRYSQHFMQPEGSLPCSEEPSTGPFIQTIRPGPNPFVTFHNKLIFLRCRVVSPTPNPPLEDNPFLVGCPRLLIQYIRSCRSYPQPEDAPSRGDNGGSTL
jgi:hypothetical protein